MSSVICINCGRIVCTDKEEVVDDKCSYCAKGLSYVKGYEYDEETGEKLPVRRYFKVNPINASNE